MFGGKLNCWTLLTFLLLISEVSMSTESGVLPNERRKDTAVTPTNMKNSFRQSKRSKNSCISMPCRDRGACKETEDGYQCVCYENFFENPDNDCHDEVNHCASNPCKNGGICEPVWGNYFCTCSRDYFGQNCQKENNREITRTSRPQFLYYLDQYVGKGSQTFLIFDGEVGSDFSFKYSSGSGIEFIGDATFLDDNIEPAEVVEVLKYSNIVDKIPKEKKKLFYLPENYPHKDNVHQYESETSLQLYNGGELQFAGQYRVYLHINPDHCVPAIELKDCGESTKTTTMWVRGKKHTIRSRVVRYCGDDTKLDFTWGIFTLSKEMPYPLMNVIKGSQRRSNFQIVPNPARPAVAYNIEPYSFRYGAYVMYFEAEELMKKRTSPPHVSHTMCWFQIKPDPLIAHIKGGKVKTISDQTELVLDATESKDPNEPDTDQDHLVFTWSCEPKTTDVCQNMAKLTGQKIITLKPSVGVYYFTITASADETKTPTVGTYPEKTLPPASNYTQKAYVVKDKVTKLSIKCVKNCRPQAKTSYREVLYLKAKCSEVCDGSQEEGFYQWSASEIILNEENTDLGTSVDKLIIKEHVLTPGRTYTITVKGGLNGNATIHIAVRNLLDLGDGSCVVDPTEGISGIDLFNFSCDFPEESSGFPIKFELFQTQDPSDPETGKVQCVKNCRPQAKTSYREVLYLKAKCSEVCDGSQEEGFYQWSASEIILNEENTDLGTSVDKLIIKEHVLTPGRTYTITVKGGLNGNATIHIAVRNLLDLGDGSCVVDPTEGISGIDLFNFSCDFPEESSGFPIKFELFQTQDPSDPETAILISYSFKPRKSGFILMAGPSSNYRTKLSIRASDHFGEFVWKDIVDVTVRPLTDSTDKNEILKAIKELVSGESGKPSLQAYISGGDMSGAVRLISALTVTLDESNNVDQMAKQQLKDQFVDVISKIPVLQISAVKQVASVLHLVLGAMQKKTEPLLHHTVLTSANILQIISHQLHVEVNYSYEEMQLSSEEIANVSRMVLESSAMLFSSMAITMDRLTTTTVAPENVTEPDYPAYSDLEFDYIDNTASFKRASTKIVTSIENIGKAVLSRLGEEQNEKMIDVGSISSWIKVDRPNNLANKLIGAGDEGMKISSELANEMQKKTDHIAVQVSIIRENPFKWDLDSQDLNTGFVMVNIWDRMTNEVFDLPEPIDLYVNARMDDGKEEVAEGSVTVPLSAIHDEDVLEDCITVHKLPAKRGQTPYLRFKPMSNPSIKLQVVVAIEVRPSMEHFREHSGTVPHDGQEGDALTLLVDGVSTLDNAWFYVGILPHPDTLQDAAKSMGERANLTISYSFQVKTLECCAWNMNTMSWNSEGCRPGTDITPVQLHCRCSHLSVFSGSLLTPPSSIDPFQDITFILLFAHNFVIFGFVMSILALYFLLLLWARWKDKHDIVQARVTVLEDNYPSSQYTYLVAVYTGYRRHAGTTSNVGIQLVGEQYKSTAHILTDSKKVVHTRGSESWFMLCTSRWLGDLVQIHLWIDNSGHRPSWYCERVVVRDTQRRQVWTFLVHRWLSVVHRASSAHYVIQSATEDELYNWRILFRDHVCLGFQEQHIWSNIFLRHPRSTYTRVQRLTVTLGILTSTMLASIILYSIPTGIPIEQLDEGQFHFPGKELVTAVGGSLIAFPIHLLLVLLFRKTAPKEEEYHRKTNLVPCTESLEQQSHSGTGDKEEQMTNDTQGSDEGKEPIINKPNQNESVKNKAKRWNCFLTVIMMEPLIHQVLDVKNSSDSSSTSLIQEQPEDGSEYSGERTKLHQKKEGWNKRANISGYWFPHWFIKVAWTLCILVIIVSASLMILYGLRYGKVRSQMWIVAILLAIVLSILVLQPLKVLLFALILSLLYKKQPSTLHCVGIVPKTEEKLEERQLRNMRAQKMYQPLKNDEILELEQRERTRTHLSELLGDLCMFAVYIITLYWVVLGTSDSLAYYSTKSLQDVVIISDHFRDITSGEQFFTYMEKTLIPALHQNEWYNGDEIQEKGVTPLYDTRLLGIVRLRQLRIKNETCKVAKELKSSIGTCNAEFTMAYQDKKNYSIAWSPFEAEAFRLNRRTAPWLYHSAWESGTVPEKGTFSLYPGGGYITTLGRTLENSLIVFNFLRRYNWFDPLTRAIFVEFTTYNANRNLFNIVTLLVEVSPAGIVHCSQDIKTLQLLVNYHELKVSIMVAIILWLTMLVLFMGRQMIRFGHISIRSYFSSWWNIVDLIIIVLGIGTVILYILRSKSVSFLIKNLEAADGNEYVNFIWAAYWQVQLRYFMAALVCLSTARLWKLLRFGYQFRSFEKTLFVASHALIPLTLMMLIMIAGFAFFGHVFIGHMSFWFSSVFFSLSTMILYGIGFSELSDRDFFDADYIIGPLSVIIFWLTYIVYLLNLFTTIIILAHEYSQKELSVFRREYTMLDYLWDEMLYHYSIIKNKKEEPDAQISLRERYAHYFQKTGRLQHIADNEEVNLPTQENHMEREIPVLDKSQKFFTRNGQQKDTNLRNWKQNQLPLNISNTSVSVMYMFTNNSDKSGLFNRTFANTIQDTAEANNRLRGGADNIVEEVYVPAVAIPKPDEVRLTKTKEISKNRLEAMRLVALDTLQKPIGDNKLESSLEYDKRQQAMAAVALDVIEKSNSSEQIKKQDVFYPGLDVNEPKLVPDDKLLKIEINVNKMAAEKLVAQQEKAQIADSIAEEEEVDDLIESPIDEAEETEAIDILNVQLDRLMALVNKWELESETEGDLLDDDFLRPNEVTETQHDDFLRPNEVTETQRDDFLRPNVVIETQQAVTNSKVKVHCHNENCPMRYSGLLGKLNEYDIRDHKMCCDHCPKRKTKHVRQRKESDDGEQEIYSNNAALPKSLTKLTEDLKEADIEKQDKYNYANDSYHQEKETETSAGKNEIQTKKWPGYCYENNYPKKKIKLLQKIDGINIGKQIVYCNNDNCPNRQTKLKITRYPYVKEGHDFHDNRNVIQTTEKNSSLPNKNSVQKVHYYDFGAASYFNNNSPPESSKLRVKEGNKLKQFGKSSMVPSASDNVSPNSFISNHNNLLEKHSQEINLFNQDDKSSKHERKYVPDQIPIDTCGLNICLSPNSCKKKINQIKNDKLYLNLTNIQQLYDNKNQRFNANSDESVLPFDVLNVDSQGVDTKSNSNNS